MRLGCRPGERRPPTKSWRQFSTALAVPSVLLFGPVAPSAWGPVIDADLHTVLWHGDGTGDPHGAEPDPHLLQITPDEVLTAATVHFGSEVHA